MKGPTSRWKKHVLRQLYRFESYWLRIFIYCYLQCLLQFTTICDFSFCCPLPNILYHTDDKHLKSSTWLIMPRVWNTLIWKGKDRKINWNIFVKPQFKQILTRWLPILSDRWGNNIILVTYILWWYIWQVITYSRSHIVGEILQRITYYWWYTLWRHIWHIFTYFGEYFLWCIW